MARKHAEWSASATERNLHCPGALALIATVGPGPGSLAAARGTAMHSVIEASLRNGTEPIELLDMVVKTDAFDIQVDAEMVDAAKVCTDYARSLLRDDTTHWIEDSFSLAAIDPPIEAGGTSDFVVWSPDIATIEVIDYKGGRGHVVEVTGNPQLRTYGLGVLLAHPQLPAERVKLTVVQPRASHADGPIRSEEIHVADLIDFANDILTGMRRSQQAMIELRQAGSDQAKLDAWRDTWLQTGRCTFCPAAGGCPALRKEAQRMVERYWDDSDTSIPNIKIADNAPETVERDLDVIELMEEWIAARRVYAHQLAEGGHQFVNWTLVERNGHRKWNAVAENEAVEQIVAATDLPMAECFTKILKSPKGIEDMLGSSRKRKIANLFHTPVIGKDLVRRSKAVRRRPATTLVDMFFNA